MGSGPARSATITASARRCAVVSSKGSAARKRATRVPPTAPVISRGDDVVAEGPGVVLEGPAPQHQGQLETEELVEDQPAPGRCDRIAVTRGRGWPARRRSGPTGPATAATRRRAGRRGLRHAGVPPPRSADLPAGEPGLRRSRVDGKDPQGAPLPADHRLVHPGHHVDHRVGHLARAPVIAHLPPEDGLGPRGSCLARHGWLKKTTSIAPVSSRDGDRRRRCGPGCAPAGPHPLHLGQNGRLGRPRRGRTRRPAWCGRCSGAGRWSTGRGRSRRPTARAGPPCAPTPSRGPRRAADLGHGVCAEMPLASLARPTRCPGDRGRGAGRRGGPRRATSGYSSLSHSVILRVSPALEPSPSMRVTSSCWSVSRRLRSRRVAIAAESAMAITPSRESPIHSPLRTSPASVVASRTARVTSPGSTLRGRFAHAGRVAPAAGGRVVGQKGGEPLDDAPGRHHPHRLLAQRVHLLGHRPDVLVVGQDHHLVGVDELDRLEKVGGGGVHRLATRPPGGARPASGRCARSRRRSRPPPRSVVGAGPARARRRRPRARRLPRGPSAPPPPARPGR